MDDCESPSQCLSVYLLLPYIIYIEVGCHEHPLRSDRAHLSELVFCLEALMLGPFLEIT